MSIKLGCLPFPLLPPIHSEPWPFSSPTIISPASLMVRVLLQFYLLYIYTPCMDALSLWSVGCLLCGLLSLLPQSSKTPSIIHTTSFNVLRVSEIDIITVTAPPHPLSSLKLAGTHSSHTNRITLFLPGYIQTNSARQQEKVLEAGRWRTIVSVWKRHSEGRGKSMLFG